MRGLERDRTLEDSSPTLASHYILLHSKVEIMEERTKDFQAVRGTLISGLHYKVITEK